MKFVGRNSEQDRIQKVLKSGESSIILLYGRRRIGKTELIRECLKDRRAVYFDGLENHSKTEQLDSFLIQVGIQFQKPEIAQKKVSSWTEAFALLYECLKENPAHVVFDEFQWMANYRSSPVSELKMIWDVYISRIPGTVLFLSGSIASFMLDKVLNSSALYGRIETIINLKEFTLSETREFLENRGAAEVWQARMLFGGVPQYLKLAKKAPSISLALRDQYLTGGSYLSKEFGRIFTSHFGRNPHYEKVVRTLADNIYGLARTDLVSKSGIPSGGHATSILKDLESAGFIRREYPFDSTSTARKIRYSLADAFLRFYFAFVEPNETEIHQRNAQQIYQSVVHSGAYHNWIGRAFEQVCTDHANKLAEIIGFSDVRYTTGSFFKSAKPNQQGVQVDLVFNRSDQVLTLCEMKHHEATIGIEVIREVEKKQHYLQTEFPRKTVIPILISMGPVSREVENQGYFSKIIRGDELLEE